ncbi:MAG: hypothetical protein PF689_13175 [Deltaproteobacteria bacterium]|jgi:hypothetical protein|nr:hypothetical protein [Deltaproteobacteria bacterium]
MKNSRKLVSVYRELGLKQIPRFISMVDRNPLSPTYGCANREYWLARSTDFPSSIAQYGILGLALAYSNKFVNNPYFKHPKVGNWILACMNYLTQIQHHDGSFDEFYPNERGWAGPTGFLLHSMNHGYLAIKDIISPDDKSKIINTMLKAAKFLGENNEIGVLANHHAMALLPLRETINIFNANHLEPLFKVRKNEFLKYCNPEGWCLEYDGVDPGYLSATVSFLGRLKQVKPDSELDEVAHKAIDFSKYFVYPNNHYGGTVGSRETFHFYSHGYEIYGREKPLALTQANHMIQGFKQGSSVYPSLQADRYFVYRIPEFLFSARDFSKRPAKLPPLPWQEDEDNIFYFKESGIWGGKQGNLYLVSNLSKGGNFKLFKINDKKTSGTIITSDCGISGITENNQIFTSSWIEKDKNISTHGIEASLTTRCLTLNSQTFNPAKMSVFRAGMAAMGWHHKAANQIKGAIRKVLMLRNNTLPITLNRIIKFHKDRVEVIDKINCSKNLKVKKLLLGEELPVRYVPQSRYFQPDELQVKGRELTKTELKILKNTGKLTIKRTFTA